MTALWRILLALCVWALILGPGSPLAIFISSPLGILAYADTEVSVTGSDGGYGENGGNVDLKDIANGSADYLSLFQEAIGGKGGYGDNLLPPGRGGYASSILTGLSLGTYSTFYNVSATGGQGGYALSGSRANGGWVERPWPASSSRVRVIFTALPAPPGAAAAMPTAKAKAATVARPVWVRFTGNPPRAAM